MPTRQFVFFRELSSPCQSGKLSAARIIRLESKYTQSHKLLTHHDALEFLDGQIVLLTNLLEGQEATLLQLPAHHAISAN